MAISDFLLYKLNSWASVIEMKSHLLIIHFCELFVYSLISTLYDEPPES